MQAQSRFKSSRLWFRGLVVLITVLLALGTVWRAGPSTVAGHPFGSTHTHSDFTAYLAGGQAIRNGSDIYKAHNERDWAYVYLPPLAILAAPLTRLPLPASVLLWFLICVAALSLGIRYCRRLVGAGAGPLDSAKPLLPVVLALPFIVDGLARGQASVVVAAAVFAMFYYDAIDQPVRAAGCLAVAVVLKVFPLALLAYFVWRRRWRFCVFSVVFMILGGLLFPACVLGWQSAVHDVIEWMHVVGLPALTPGSKAAYFPQLLQPDGLHNQSLYAVLTRVSEAAVPALKPYVQAVSDGVSVGLFLIICRVERRAAHKNALFVTSALVVWLLIAAPVTELHYYILLLLPLFAILYRAPSLARAKRWLARGLLTLFGLFAVSVPVLGDALNVVWFYGGLCLLCFALLGGLLIMAWQPNESRDRTRTRSPVSSSPRGRRAGDLPAPGRPIPTPLVS
ncbi:glycosyltransferase family 87 protein [Salinisphaera hydrothermalis]|uniref:glycosyltransferase family 87 protein n=1 Tax=Salinisphaera hydrothermalis TaxID=563188 RepID=UPI0033413C53